LIEDFLIRFTHRIKVAAWSTLPLARSLPALRVQIWRGVRIPPWPSNGSGLQWSTVRNLLLAWVLTLPAAITLAGLLYILLRHVF
jgi:phosphate/sulfate permease